MVDKDGLNKLFRYALALGASQADAADLVQETLEKTLLHFEGPEGTQQGWMRKTLRNRHIDNLRRLQRFTHEEMDSVEEQEVLALESSTLEDEIIQEGQFEHFWGHLKPREKELVYLWAIEGYTAAEIGQQMDCSRNTVLSKIHRVKTRLTKMFKKDNTVNSRSGSAPE